MALFRGITAAVVFSAVLVMSALVVLERPISEGNDQEAASPTLALAPISLGNPAAAATLRTRNPDTPEALSESEHTYSFTVEVAPGDTLTKLLVRAGVEHSQAVVAISALEGYYKPRNIRPGQDITVILKPETAGVSPGRFLGFSLAPDFRRRITVRSDEEGEFRASEDKIPLTLTVERVTGTIRNSLFVDGTESGMPVPVLIDLIRSYSWDVDFQRDIRTGDRFEVLYERHRDPQGKAVHNGSILYSSLILSGARHANYLFTSSDGQTDYFDDEGRSVRKALMRTPIDGARLSSGFGRRKDPILGFTKVHLGVDFAAPTGTPIYAAGDGTVIYAGRKGGYGKYVRIRHNSDYKTAYAHMSRIATAKGRRVKQGQVIGYVGATGRSTGPHLHYEIFRNERQVNPLKVKMPSGRRLKGEELNRFQLAKSETDRRVAELTESAELASSTDNTDSQTD